MCWVTTGTLECWLEGPAPAAIFFWMSDKIVHKIVSKAADKHNAKFNNHFPRKEMSEQSPFIILLTGGLFDIWWCYRT